MSSSRCLKPLKRVRAATSLYFALFSTVFFLCISPVIQGEEDGAYFYAPLTGKTETHVAYEGEEPLSLRVIFGQNCTNWSVEIQNPLFARDVRDVDYEQMPAGMKMSRGIDLNPNATPGEYNVTIYFNYTDEQENYITNTFHYLIVLQQTLEIKSITIPNESERVFSLEVQTFVVFSWIEVLFDSDGDVDVHPEKLHFSDLQPGNYTFETQIKRDASFADDKQEVGYYIGGSIGNRTVEFTEKNIEVSISWDESVKENVSATSTALLICGIIAVAIIFNYHHYRKKG